MASTSNAFADSIFARLIALAIAIGIGWVFYTNYRDDVEALGTGQAPLLPVAETSTEPAKEANPALEACLARRVGDVERMRDEGIINEARYGTFRQRAEDLCMAQNPG